MNLARPKSDTLITLDEGFLDEYSKFSGYITILIINYAFRGEMGNENLKYLISYLDISMNDV